MKLANHFKPLFLGILACVLVLGLNSCGKQGDTIAKIKVISISDSSPINNATVILDPDNEVLEHKPNIIKEATTNSNGEASFNYNELYRRGTAGLFVLEVRVEATINGVPTEAEGIIKIEEETTSEATIEI